MHKRDIILMLSKSYAHLKRRDYLYLYHPGFQPVYIYAFLYSLFDNTKKMEECKNVHAEKLEYYDKLRLRLV